MNTTDIDKKPDDVALKQFLFKNNKLLACCLVIAEKALQRGKFWPDEIPCEFLVSNEDRNCIGSAWRILSKTLPIIEKTGSYRRSHTKDANGRTIFEYVLIDQALAKTLLRRHDKAKCLMLCEPQLNLGLCDHA
jgi:hypothetical protein